MLLCTVIFPSVHDSFFYGSPSLAVVITSKIKPCDMSGSLDLMLSLLHDHVLLSTPLTNSLALDILTQVWRGMIQREGRGCQFPYPPVSLNQQALRLTVKRVWERRSSYPHSVTCSLLNERSLGQSSSVTCRSSGREKVEWLAHRLFAPKCHYSLEKFEEPLVLDRSQREKHADLCWLWEGHSSVKKERKKSEQRWV